MIAFLAVAWCGLCRALAPSSATAQPVVWMENLSKSYDGLRKQLDETSLTLRAGQRCCLVGHNGCGKSTLLRVVAGVDSLDSGEVRVRKGVRVTSVDQEPLTGPADAARTVSEVLLSGDGLDVRAARRYAECVAELEACPTDEACAARFEKATEAMTDSDGWAVEAAVATAVAKLSIAHLCDRKVADLSGGERKRVSLASALLAKADVLVLDEPTNHLDLWAVRWLEEYLSSDVMSNCVVLFVTHDRAFAENVATTLAELDAGKLYEHAPEVVAGAVVGSLVDAYLDGKAKRLTDAQSASSAARAQLRVELAWLRRGAKARQTKSTERIARFDGLSERASAVNGRADLALATGTVKKTDAYETRKKTIIVTEGLGASREQTEGEEQDWLFADFDREFGHTDRIGIVGANGAGKSTLVRAILASAAASGALVGASPSEIERLMSDVAERGNLVGEARVSAKRVAYYSQNPNNDESLSAFDTALEVVARRSAELLSATDGQAQAAALLNRYQFTDGSMWHSPGSKLSGGERRRLQLMAVLDSNPDLLVLDEPSNDLDIAALQSLERYLLESHVGALLLVSHDRALLDATCDELLVLPGDGYVSSFSGSMGEYIELLDGSAAESETEAKLLRVDPAGRKNDVGRNKEADKAAQKRRYNGPKRIAQLEKLVESKERELAAIEAALKAAASDASAALKLFNDQAAMQANIDALYEEWEDLESLLAEDAALATA